MTDDRPDGYDRLRGVILRAIEQCEPGHEDELRQRFVAFAAGLDADDLAIFEQVISDLNEGPDIRIERELEAMLVTFLSRDASHQ